jgi:thiaminase/transcriptional activator TenA
MTRADYGRGFALWRQASGATWRGYARHAFVEGLRDGTLPRAAYLHYLVQDYVFLVHFARAWALAVVKAETQAEMRAAAATVDALVNQEMTLHVTTCAAEGLGEDALLGAAEAPANLAYTRYVLEAGYTGDFLDLMAALAPCVLGYGEIGARLAAEADPATPYGDWIGAYAGEEYQETCRRVGALIDAALARRLGEDFAAAPRWPRLTGRFVTATRLEIGFWDMGLAPASAEPAPA